MACKQQTISIQLVGRNLNKVGTSAIDAGFHKEQNKTSTSWCLRDHTGRFVMAETTRLDENYTVVEGEAIALIEAMKAMEQRRLSHVIF
jgi:hypothetical protein